MKRPKIDKLPYEIFEYVQGAPAKERVERLREYNSWVLRTILQGALDPRIEFSLPEGSPPYSISKSPAGLGLVRVQNVLRPITTLLKTSPVPQFKKERIFIGMLETLHEKDAEVFIAMKDKALTKKYPAITVKLVNEAFPGLISEPESEKKESPAEKK